MTPLIASILMHGGGGPYTFLGGYLALLAVVAAILGSICWTKFSDWIERTRYRNWPTVSAVVDIVSVAYCEDDSPIPAFQASLNNPYYLATLTYIYHYPEEQMGDYSRSFGNEDDAKSWANSYKGETVKVHVDPRDPTRSVLREDDL